MYSLIERSKEKNFNIVGLKTKARRKYFNEKWQIERQIAATFQSGVFQERGRKVPAVFPI